ncbi:MAG: hypothetical protein ACK559_10610 [bacterium]
MLVDHHLWVEVLGRDAEVDARRDLTDERSRYLLVGRPPLELLRYGRAGLDRRDDTVAPRIRP